MGGRIKVVCSHKKLLKIVTGLQAIFQAGDLLGWGADDFQVNFWLKGNQPFTARLRLSDFAGFC